MTARLLGILVCILTTAAWAAEPAIGERIQVRPDDLPKPYANDSVSNPPLSLKRPADTVLSVPKGFRANLFAAGLEHARWLAVAPNGDVFLAEPDPGRITLLRDSDGDGRADLKTTFQSGFKRPHGMAFHGDFLYVADTEAVWRIPYQPGATEAVAKPERVTPPGALGKGDGHWTRNIVFHPDGSRFYVAVGSRGNIGEEAPPRATIQEFQADGSGQRSFATGLRNPVGIDFRPGTTELWSVVNERDGLGDGLVPDYFTHVREGGFYGWPYAYIGPHPQPELGGKRPDLVARSIIPDILFRSHSAPLGMTFYRGESFPPDYRDDAFIALHGSWNAAEPRGYMVVRVPFRDSRPAGWYEPFASGFRTGGNDRARVWGRPVGLAVAKDGSLLVADDESQTIWRISAER